MVALLAGVDNEKYDSLIGDRAGAPREFVVYDSDQVPREELVTAEQQKLKSLQIRNVSIQVAIREIICVWSERLS